MKKKRDLAPGGADAPKRFRSRGFFSLGCFSACSLTLFKFFNGLTEGLSNYCLFFLLLHFTSMKENNI